MELDFEVVDIIVKNIIDGLPEDELGTPQENTINALVRLLGRISLHLPHDCVDYLALNAIDRNFPFTCGHAPRKEIIVP